MEDIPDGTTPLLNYAKDLVGLAQVSDREFFEMIRDRNSAIYNQLKTKFDNDTVEQIYETAEKLSELPYDLMPYVIYR